MILSYRKKFCLIGNLAFQKPFFSSQFAFLKKIKKKKLLNAEEKVINDSENLVDEIEIIKKYWGKKPEKTKKNWWNCFPGNDKEIKEKKANGERHSFLNYEETKKKTFHF